MIATSLRKYLTTYLYSNLERMTQIAVSEDTGSPYKKHATLVWHNFYTFYHFGEILQFELKRTGNEVLTSKTLCDWLSQK